MLLVLHIGCTHSHPFGIIVILVAMPHSLSEHIIGNPYVVQLLGFLKPLAWIFENILHNLVRFLPKVLGHPNPQLGSTFP